MAIRLTRAGRLAGVIELPSEPSGSPPSPGAIQAAVALS